MQRIAIHSVPRSGSTWLGSIFDSQPEVIYKLQPLFSYALKDRLTPISTKKEIDDFFDDLEKSRDDFMDQKDGKDKGIIPVFKKEKATTIVYKEVRYHHLLKNLMEKEDGIKVIGLIRNPLSAISSWLKAPKEFRAEKGWKVEEEWQFAAKKNLNKAEEFNGYEKWKEVTYIFESLQKQYPTRFYLLNYDDLLEDMNRTVEKLFEFCNIGITEQTRNFIYQSKSTEQADPYSVFKSKKKDDAYKRNLPQCIIDEITNDLDFVKFNKKYHWV